jgi:putative DNA-invertase from lambdoid prophage Rac
MHSDAARPSTPRLPGERRGRSVAALFAKLASGDILIAAKLDRLFRSTLREVVEGLKARGVKLSDRPWGDIAGNGLSKLFLTIAAAFAEAERDRIRERVGQSKADQKRRGRYLGGLRPFGFRLGERSSAALARIRLRVLARALWRRGYLNLFRAIVRVKGVNTLAFR